jgi:hypothetical protein
MKKYEYKYELNLGSDPDDGEDHTEESLNLLGNEGWDLVAVSPCGKGNSYTGFWFKRPLG